MPDKQKSNFICSGKRRGWIYAPLFIKFKKLRKNFYVHVIIYLKKEKLVEYELHPTKQNTKLVVAAKKSRHVLLALNI